MNETMRQHAIGLLALYGVTVHGMTMDDALTEAEKMADDPANDGAVTSREAFGLFDAQVARAEG